MTLIERLYILALLITMLVLLSYGQESKAGSNTGSFSISITVQPMCPVRGIIIPVEDKKACLELQRTGTASQITETSDGNQIVTY